MVKDPKEQLVFLSSLCHELRTLRKEIHHAFLRSTDLPRLFVDEIDRPKTEAERRDHFNIVGHITETISQSDAVLVIVGQISDILYDHGSIISDESEVSFWEIELYHAAIIKLPTYIIVEEGVELTERTYLANILTILPSLKANIYFEKRELIKAKSIALIERGSLDNESRVEGYLNCLQSLRSSPYDHHLRLFDKKASSYQFKDIQFVNPHVNQSLLKSCLLVAQKETQYQRRISHYYLAYRELLKIPYWKYQDTDILLDWAVVASGLSDDLRWYGVHGHLQMGVLQYTVDYGSVYTLLKDKGHRMDEGVLSSPYAMFASEYFSLHKYIQGENIDKAFFNIGLGLKKAQREADKINMLSIRGACFLSEHNFKAAAADLQVVFEALSRDGGDVSECAHTQVKLGACYFFMGDKKKGFELADAGMALLNRNDANKVRSLRVMEVLYTHSNQLFKAAQAKQEALKVAFDIGALDQVRKIQLNMI